MKILSIEIENFMALGSTGRINLDGQGLVLIQGVNLDDTSAASNGVGKSSIPDALSWVNFGETAREVSGDDVVNDVAKKNCMVAEVVQVGDVVYRIERYRKHATYKNQTRVQVANPDRSIWTDISKGTEKETQALIEQILGCSKDVFMAAIYAGQETAPDLPKMTDKQLKLLIEEAAGVEKIESALQLARSREAANSKSMMMVQAKREGHAGQLADAEALQVRFVASAADFESGRATRRNTSLASAKATLAMATDKKAELATFPDEDSIDKELVDIAAKLATHRGFVEKAEAKRRELAVVQRTADRVTGDLTRAIEVVRKTKAAIENAPEEMKKPCTECGKPHTESELDEFVAHLKERVAREMVAVKELQAQYVAQKSSLEAASEAAKAAEAEIYDVVAVTERKTQLLAEKGKIATVRMKIEQHMKEAREEMKRAEIVLTEDNPYKVEAELVSKRILDLTALITTTDTELAALRKRATVLENAVKVFGPAGVRAHILDTVTPFLNAQTADYLSALSDGNITATWSTLSTTAKGEMREKFNIDVTNDKGAKSFKGLSGGEKRKVRLATMLALQDLVATRASNPIQLWIGDEIDDALDKSGLERLMGVLERKAREKGTVLIISHNSLTDWCDRVAVVTKEGGKSTVAGALS